MARISSRYRNSKPKPKRQESKSFHQIAGHLARRNKPVKPRYADSTKSAIAFVWKRWTQFCAKIYAETKYFSTADPVEVCQKHMYHETARSFLEFSCEQANFGHANSLFVFARTWRMGVYLHTCYRLDHSIAMDMKNYIMDTLIEEYGLEETGKFKKVMNSDDILSLAHHFWVLHDAYYPDERQRVQHWLMDVFCFSTTARAGTVVESSCYFGRNQAVEYRDIYLFAMRDPENPPGGVKIGMHIQLRLLKGRRNRGNPPVIKFVERRDTPSFCLVKAILGVAFKDMAFASPWIEDPRDLWATKIPSRLQSVPIHWAPKWMNVPLLRRTVRDPTGQIITSPTLAAQFTQMATWNRRLGISFGMEECFEFKMLRRTAAATLHRTVGPEVRNKIMGHENSSIFEHYYQNDIVDADVVAAVLEKPSDQAAMRLLGHVSLTRDPNAPHALTKGDRQKVATDPEVQEARESYLQSVTALRTDHVTVSAARKKARLDVELQERVDHVDRLRKESSKIQARKESDLLASLRTEYFATLGDTCLENQYTGREEPAGPAPPAFCFSEREALTKLFFPAPTTPPPSIERQVEDGCQIIRLLASLCGRREYPRPRRQRQQSCGDPEQSKLDTVAEGPLDMGPCFVDTCPDIFPVQCPGTQCLFCLGDGSLATVIRTRCFKNTYTLTRHVHNQHLNHLQPKSSFLCPHPSCQVAGFKCQDKDGFKIHALQVHNVIHGA